MKIKAQKNGALNEHDRLAVAALLIKSGYTVRLGRERLGSTSKYEYFVEALDEEDMNNISRIVRD